MAPARTVPQRGAEVLGEARVVPLQQRENSRLLVPVKCLMGWRAVGTGYPGEGPA